MNRRIRLGLAAVAAVVASVGVVGIAPDAAHALSCHGSTCNGKNPVAYGCGADATTVNSVTYEDHAAGGTFGKMVVQLRHSNHCAASWSRVLISAGGTAHVTYGKAYMDPYKITTTRTRFSAGSISSNMRAGSSVTACGRGNFNNGAVVVVRCTSAG